MRNRSAAVVAALLFGLTPLVASGQGAPPALTPVTVASIGSTDMTPFYYAIQQGLFQKAGLDVTVTQAPTGAASTTAVVGGAAQIGFSNLLALSIAHQRGIAVEMLAPGVEYDTNAPNVGILVANDSPIKTPKELEGRIVGVTGLHDLLAVATIAWIQRGGADSSKVKFIELPPSVMPEALKAGRVDAVAIYEPFVGSVVASGARIIGKPYDAIGPRFVNAAWFALEPWVNTHRILAVRFARVIHDAAEYTNNHYDELIPLVSSFSKLSPETLQKMVHARVSTSLSPELVQPVIDLAARFHEIPAPFRAQDMLVPGIP